jgi:hypothetical protein
MRLPSFAKSRTVVVMSVLAVLNLLDLFGEIQAAMSAMGVNLDPQIVRWVNVVGVLLGAYFRIAQRQQLGAGKGPLTPEERAAVEQKLTEQLAEEKQNEVH